MGVKTCLGRVRTVTCRIFGSGQGVGWRRLRVPVSVGASSCLRVGRVPAARPGAGGGPEGACAADRTPEMGLRWPRENLSGRADGSDAGMVVNALGGKTCCVSDEIAWGRYEIPLCGGPPLSSRRLFSPRRESGNAPGYAERGHFLASV